MIKSSRGFTIVELLIVIVVIGILAAITVVAYRGVTGRANDSKRYADLTNIQKALELYRIDNGGYPICGSASPYVAGGALSYSSATNCLTTPLVPKYIASIPVDPKNSGSFQYFYAVGYKKNGTASYVADYSDNYMMGGKSDVITSPFYGGWGPSDLSILVGSSN